MVSMKSSLRISIALVVSFVLGLAISLFNGRNPILALQAGLVFAVLVGILVGLLSWGMEIASKKGYPDWAGFLAVLFLNVPGLLLLVILPSKVADTKRE